MSDLSEVKIFSGETANILLKILPNPFIWNSGKKPYYISVTENLQRLMMKP